MGLCQGKEELGVDGSHFIQRIKTYVLSRGTSRTLHPPWKIFDHKSTAGRLEKQKYVWPTGQTPSEGLSTSGPIFDSSAVLFPYVWRLGWPRKKSEISIFECIKGHYTFLFESEKSVKINKWIVISKSFSYKRRQEKQTKMPNDSSKSVININ